MILQVFKKKIVSFSEANEAHETGETSWNYAVALIITTTTTTTTMKA